jgi:GT2 family glycosyltransferase
MLADAAERDDLEALVLLHEDTEIVDPAFCARVREALADPRVGVAGAVGANEVRSLSWWEGPRFGRVVEPRWRLDYGGGRHDVQAVDGLLLVLSPWTVRNLRFDETAYAGFHGYDVDLCFQIRAAGRRVIVDELDVVHHTRGGFGDKDAFLAADRVWRRKWLPKPGLRERATRVRQSVRIRRYSPPSGARVTDQRSKVVRTDSEDRSP